MLDATSVSRSLDVKSTILWLEVVDLFAVAIVCACLNLAFGQTALKVPLVYIPTLALAIALILAKRGKPDGFLKHFLRYGLRPTRLSCFPLDLAAAPYRVSRNRAQRGGRA
jgi:hypothetical protein